MFSRREFLMAATATSALLGSGMAGSWSKLMAQQGLSEDALLSMEPTGNVTLVHITDIHAQLKPLYFREPSINLGIGDVQGLPPHVTGADFLKLYNIAPGSPDAYALTCEDFVALAKSYGKMGGMDRVATIVKRIRSERGDNMLLLDGGDTWQGSYTSNQTLGQDMITVMNALEPDAMTGHWEFTYGTDRVKEAIESLPFAFLGSNIYDNEWDEPAFEAWKMFERGGVKIGVIGQAFPYTPIANPRWMIPGWSFGIREEDIAQHVEEARAEGAELVVLLSHNGFDVDRKLASRVDGIDVILTGHTHDALPEPVIVNDTLVIASGSNGKFVSRLDLDVQDGKVAGYEYRLIPVFSDVITPDPEMAAIIDTVRAPYEKELARKLGTTEDLLYRPRQLQRHLRRPDLSGAAGRTRCTDCAVAWLPLGHQPASGPGYHRGRPPQRLCHDLSGRLPLEHDRPDAEGHSGRRRRQPVQQGSLLPAGRRHGPRRAAWATPSTRTRPSASVFPA